MAENTPTRYIRSSMLPSWADCARRTAGKQYRNLLAEHGFELRKLSPSVGAAVGTATHAAAAILLRAKMAGRPLAPAEAIESATAKFMEEIGAGAEWDDTTPNFQAARKQIASLVTAYLPLIAKRNPIMVEEQLRSTVADGWLFTGTVDLVEADGALDDLKTGVLPRPYIQQLGGYALLLEANGHEVPAARITFIKRVSVKKPQPIPIIVESDLEPARRLAWAAIQEIREGVERFAASGDPYAFRANPMSLMCSQKYCPARGTAFCKAHMKGD